MIAFTDEFDPEVVKIWSNNTEISHNDMNRLELKKGYFPNAQDTKVSLIPKNRVKRAVSI